MTSPERVDPDAPPVLGRRPVLGLLVVDAPAELVGLLVALRSRCVPQFSDGSGQSAPVAYLVHGSEPPPDRRPYALWVDHAADLDGPLARAARVLLTHDAAVADDGPSRDLVVVPFTGAYDGVSPVAVFVRRRIRAARGLPDQVVAALEDGTWSWGQSPVDRELADTVCALADAVAATTRDAAVRALAWAAPLVTDAQTARLVGAVDGQHCVMASTRGARLAAALELAADERTAARLSWAGRRLFEDRHDLHRAADRVGDQLGLPVSGRAGVGRLDRALGQLGAPPDAAIHDRLAAATATLVGSSTTSWEGLL